MRRTVDIVISITYDPFQFPEGDMRWAADKISECDELYNIGYDFDSFEVDATVTHGVQNDDS